MASNYLRNGTLLALLSVQVGLQPVLMKWYCKETESVALRVAVIEGFKWLIAVGSLMSQGELIQQVRQWNFRVASQTTLLPSLIYVVQNALNQNAVVILDGVTFNILNQTKIIWTAILVYVLLQKKQSSRQIVALMLLLLGAVVMTTRSHEGQSDATDQDDQGGMLFYTGVVQALIAAVLSGFAGTIIQRALQLQMRNAYMVTIELSMFGNLSLLGSTLFFFLAPVETTSTASGSMWKGWSVMTFFTMFIQAVGGIIVGFVIKYTGNVEKSFAVVVGLVLTAIIESSVNHAPFGSQGCLAVLLVGLSTYMYTKYPYHQPQPSQNSPDKSSAA